MQIKLFPDSESCCAMGNGLRANMFPSPMVFKVKVNSIEVRIPCGDGNGIHHFLNVCGSSLS
jgi:hypothetical protein